jgi:hypothetical protein
MSSAAQARANLENAQHSTGPVTPEGKARVSINPVAHGLTAEQFRLLPWESEAEYKTHIAAVRNQLKPETPEEQAIVDRILQFDWLVKRAITLQTTILFKPDITPADQRKIDLFMRYETTHDRALSRARKELQAIRKQRESRENGSASQKRQQEAHEARVRLTNARVEAQELKTNSPKNTVIHFPNDVSVSLADIHAACTAAIVALHHQEQATATAS